MVSLMVCLVSFEVKSVPNGDMRNKCEIRKWIIVRNLARFLWVHSGQRIGTDQFPLNLHVQIQY